MARRKLTPWFPSNVKPARSGVYETSCGYQHWNGRWWGYFCSYPSAAWMYQERKSCAQNNDWRGLASNPAEKA